MKPARGKKAAKDQPKGESSSVEAPSGPGLAQTGHASRTQTPGPQPEADAAPASARVRTTEEDDEVAKDAYVVNLPVFQGPLDLLLAIIQKHELDIMDIPMGFVTEKYLEYLKLMQSLTIDVASEYLVMAATLTLIKSRMLLPDDGKTGGETDEEEEELDPRAELVRRLLEYQRYKAAGETLTQRDTLGNSVFARGASEEKVDQGPAPFAPFGVLDLLGAFKKILEKTKVKMDHEVVFDRIGITERIVELTEVLKQRRSVAFEDIFSAEGHTPSRFDLVITFLAILEMCRMKMMRVFQVDALTSIHVELLVVEEDENGDPIVREEEPDVPAEVAEAATAAMSANAVDLDAVVEDGAVEEALDDVGTLEANLAAEAFAEAERVAELEAELAASEPADTGEPEASEFRAAEAEGAGEEASRVAALDARLAADALSEAAHVAALEAELAAAASPASPEAEQVAALEAELAEAGSSEAAQVATLEAELAEAASSEAAQVAALEAELAEAASSEAAQVAALEAELAEAASSEAAQVAALEAELAATNAESSRGDAPDVGDLPLAAEEALAELESSPSEADIDAAKLDADLVEEPEVVAEPEAEVVAEPEPEVVADLVEEPEVVAEPEAEVVEEPEDEPEPAAVAAAELDPEAAELAALEAEIAALERAEAAELAALEAEIAALDAAEAAAKAGANESAPSITHDASREEDKA